MVYRQQIPSLLVQPVERIDLGARLHAVANRAVQDILHRNDFRGSAAGTRDQPAGFFWRKRGDLPAHRFVMMPGKRHNSAVVVQRIHRAAPQTRMSTTNGSSRELRTVFPSETAPIKLVSA